MLLRLNLQNQVWFLLKESTMILPSFPHTKKMQMMPNLMLVLQLLLSIKITTELEEKKK